MTTRRGASLVELLAVMSGCAVILSSSGMLIHRAMRAQSQTRGFFNVERQALGLFDQFRQDVHQAINVTAAEASREGGVLVEIDLPESQAVEYRQDAGGVLRILKRQGGPTSREVFRFSGDFEVNINVAPRSSDSPGQVILSIAAARDPLPVEDPTAAVNLASLRDKPFALQVAAIVGRDRRFASSEDRTENAR